MDPNATVGDALALLRNASATAGDALLRNASATAGDALLRNASAGADASRSGAPLAEAGAPAVDRGGFAAVSTMSMAETTAIALLASCAVGALLGLIAVMAVLVAVTRQLSRLVAVLRGEAGVHTGLLASVDAPPPDAFGPMPAPVVARAARDDGAATASRSSSSASKKSAPRTAVAHGSHEKRGRRESNALAERGTSCAIAEVDEEDDHRL